MNPYNLDITKIVKYICLTAIAIVGIVFGCLTAVRVCEIGAEYTDEWDDEE
ncbi:MAG: hypothetical protein PUD43_04345 [Clostridia bacterium]|nr:hypothetical protein [Clostridia bacterium]